MIANFSPPIDQLWTVASYTFWKRFELQFTNGKNVDTLLFRTALRPELAIFLYDMWRSYRLKYSKQFLSFGFEFVSMATFFGRFLLTVLDGWWCSSVRGQRRIPFPAMIVLMPGASSHPSSWPSLLSSHSGSSHIPYTYANRRGQFRDGWLQSSPTE